MQNATVSGGQQTPTSALTSLVAGILSWVLGLLSFCLGFVFAPCGLVLFPLFVVGSITAIVTGRRARRQIAESNGTQSGEGLAMIGLVLGWSGAALSLLIVLFFCLILVLAVLGLAISKMIPNP